MVTKYHLYWQHRKNNVETTYKHTDWIGPSTLTPFGSENAREVFESGNGKDLTILAVLSSNKAVIQAVSYSRTTFLHRLLERASP